MQKKFIGDVLRSELNEFTDSRGESVTLWKLTVALNEDRCIIFNVPKSNDSLFHKVAAVEEGQKVACIAEAVGRNDGRIRYALISIESDEPLETPYEEPSVELE